MNNQTFENIPKELKEARRWLLWRSEPGPDLTKKKRKVPYYTNETRRNGKLDTPTDLAKLVTFEQTLAALQTGKYTGLGFALGPDGTGQFWQGIDFDNLSEHPELQEITEKLPGYREVSPSGNGVHAIGYGRGFKSLGSNVTGIEAYSSGRYFTVTGEGGKGTPACLADFVEQRLKPMHDGKSSRTIPLHESEAAEKVSPSIIAALRSALTFLRADDRDLWVRMGLALKPLGDVGRGLWLDWSATSTKFDPQADAGTWDSFKTNHTGYRAVFAEAQRQGWRNPAKKIDDEKENQRPRKRKLSKAALIIGIGQSQLLFHSREKEAFAETTSNGITLVFSLRSRSFREFLNYECFKRTREGCSKTSLDDAINTLEAVAKYEGPEYPVYLRVANLNDRIYIDLGCDQWRVIEITKNGWSILTQSPVKFYRRAGMSALPEPERGGRIDWLRDYINIEEADFPILVAWILAVLGGIKPFLILLLQGEQGTGKSTTTRILRAFTDPSTVPLRAPQKEIKDLLVSASNTYLVVLENLSGLSPEMADALCRLSTGGGIDHRALYTDNEQFLADLIRPVLINGINELAGRPDFSERCLRLELPPIDGKQRDTEARIYEDFEAGKSKIFGAILDGLAGALANREAITLQDVPRMADFAEWGVAVERGLGWPAGTFMAAYSQNQNYMVEANIEGSPVGQAIIDLVKKNQGSWEGSPTELLEELNKRKPFDQKTKAWPQSTKGLNNCIKRLAPNLRRMGFTIEINRDGKARNYSISNVTDTQPNDG